jgi:hypothetical protein
MDLVITQAATSSWYTDYHCNVVTGDDTFFDMVEEHLKALLHPALDDEEIRREVLPRPNRRLHANNGEQYLAIGTETDLARYETYLRQAQGDEGACTGSTPETSG